MKDADSAYEKIWAVVRAIPRGCVATYGQVAAAAGLKKHARMAGYALWNLPTGSKIPWHRVINAQGRISFPPRSAPWREQRKRLLAEGVVFIAGRVDLARHGPASFESGRRHSRNACRRRAPGDSPLLD